MSKQIINIGASANDKTGDPLRTAFSKVNQNFTELYNQLAVDSTSVVVGSTPPSTPSEGVLWWDQTGGRLYIYYGSSWVDASPEDGVGDSIDLLAVGQSILPSINVTYDLGSSTKRWRDLYLSGNTIDLGGTLISADGNGGLTVPGGISSASELVFDDGLTIANSVIGYSSSNTITEETVGGTVSETTTSRSQVAIDASSIVITRNITQVVDDGVTTTTDEAGSVASIGNGSAYLKTYAEPDGPNNTQYAEVGTSGGNAYLESRQDDVGGYTLGGVVTSAGSVSITAHSTVDKTWTFNQDGILTLPSDNYLETIDANLTIGSQGVVTIRSDAGDQSTTKAWVFNKSGTLNTPLMLPLTFYPVLDSEHMTRGVGLTDALWEFEVQFQVNPDGTVQTSINNPAWPSNPGYIDGDEFVYVEADHGIPGYTFSLILTDIVLGEGWSANIAVSQPPVYPSTLSSQGAVKLTSNTHSLVLGTDGNLNVPGAVKQGNSKLAFNENGGTNVYLTPTTDDSTAVFINATSVQNYATELVSLQVGSGLAALELLWQELEQLWIDVRDQDAADIAPATRAWAGLPSYQAYDIIVATFPVEPAAPGNLVPVANNAKNAYNDWQTVKSGTYVGITAGGKDWRFDPDGNITLPNNGIIRVDGSNVEVGGITNFNVEATGVVNIYTNNGAHQWQFGDDGGLTFPDTTVQTTAFTGTATPNNITNSAGPSATMAVGSFTASRDHLTVRVTNNTNTLDVEINYSNPDSQALVSVYRVYPGEGNLYSGKTLKAANNTVWDLVTNLPVDGDSLSFTVTDHSFLKMYRVTVVADTMPGVTAVGEAFCVIEELK